MTKRGRRKGSVIRLLNDHGRFEIAIWLAFTELGLSKYVAAYLAMFLISDRAITTESVEGVLLKSTTTHHRRVIGHADRIRRKAPEVIARADDRELNWLAHSSGLVLALVKFAADGDAAGMSFALEQLRKAGWGETLDRISKRIEATLHSNFPPAEGPLSRAAKRLLRQAGKMQV